MTGFVINLEPYWTHVPKKFDEISSSQSRHVPTDGFLGFEKSYFGGLMAPENRPSQKETIVFQPSIFRAYVSFREGNCLTFLTLKF